LFGLTAPVRFAGAIFLWVHRRLAAPDYIAANAICDDLGLKRSWTPLPPPESKH